MATDTTMRFYSRTKVDRLEKELNYRLTAIEFIKRPGKPIKVLRQIISPKNQ